MIQDSNNLLKLIREKLAEKEEIIHEQQRQIADLERRLAEASGSGGGTSAEESEEKDALIMEQMTQINDLTEKLTAAEELAAGNADNEELIREQMMQITEMTDKIELLMEQLKEAGARMKEFEKLQGQVKELLGQ